VNIGETLQKISGFKIKATKHRVIDIGIERYSAPYFLEPKHSARIGENILQSKRKSCEDIEYENNPEN
jgi:isopenicillin N synthase-like dioxygenase